MGHARQAKFLLNPKYNIPRWQETARSVYITSARYDYEWLNFDHFKCIELLEHLKSYINYNMAMK